MLSQEPVLDEIQWRSPQAVMEFGGIHSNTVLYYFSRSPFFNETSNNAVLFSQAMHNQSMFPLIQTREAFEGHLRTMAGMEFMVVEEPAEMGPGMGTGVWVINKQMRKKVPGEEDEVSVLATYFVVGDNIYQAPTLADVINSRVATIANSMRSLISEFESVRDWSASEGHSYVQPPSKKDSDIFGVRSASQTPQASGSTSASHALLSTNNADANEERMLQRLAEESMMLHMRYGNNYIDENPITGEPGKFHLSSTGRAVAAAAAAAQSNVGLVNGVNNMVPASVAMLRGEGGTGKKEDGKKEASLGNKADRKGVPKPKRRKSKSNVSTPAAS
ncbi:hypothetical protein TD95_002472 [Thielaviopsis punctulata]|uniref:Mediator of RNA polymerase II transcription subunit 6 n=1 Tax=Thielaviopsis punctulata TaxID=72032 RepID=A0A0F4Z963_9PEZI|nr:hypothetical protein TD95_002472 [Thielaviopsis punctulata]